MLRYSFINELDKNNNITETIIDIIKLIWDVVLPTKLKSFIIPSINNYNIFYLIKIYQNSDLHLKALLIRRAGIVWISHYRHLTIHCYYAIIFKL